MKLTTLVGSECLHLL